ncbi:ATP-binding protein, partial [Butyricicoccus sp. 1XD8-22]
IIISAVINEIFSFVTDVFNAIQNSFFKSNEKFENKKIIEKGYSLEDEIGTSKLSKEKGNLPVFRSHIRVVAHSEDKLTRDTISESLALSMQDLTETNELTGVKINSKKKKKKIIDELNTLKLDYRTKHDPNVNLVSTDEMSKLALMMPNRNLQLNYSDELNVKKRVEVAIPEVLQNPNNLLIGHAELKDKQIPIALQDKNYDDFYSGYTFVGKQGSGKDTAIQNFVHEGSKKGISFIIPD